MNPNDSSDAVRRVTVCSSRSLSSTSENAISPLNLMLAATGTSGSTGPLRPSTVVRSLSLASIRWSPGKTGWALEPIWTEM